jgi:hypothetical protein
MSARKRETGKRGSATERESSGPEQGEPGRAFYVYCIGEARKLSELMREAMPSAIEDEGGLELIEEGGLAAVSSRVALDDYNEAALQANLADATWTALRAMRHERVVDYFARRASVVPLRFGTIYLERARVLKMLRERGEELRSVIERLRGREEWGVNVFCDRKALLESIVEFSPRLRELNEQAANASPGQAYLMRKKMEAMRSDEARAEVKRTVAHIEQELRASSEGAASLRVLKDEAGELGELAGKLAFLVERERFAEFRGKAERLAQETDGLGFRLELTGPWPAYNFVGSN